MIPKSADVKVGTLFFMKIKNMIYTVTIPQSKTKRFNTEPRLLKIFLNQGWGGGEMREHLIPPDQLEFQFEIPDDYEYLYRITVLDGNTFHVTVTYYNATKSREETIELVPS
jgi:hypothetical protein